MLKYLTVALLAFAPALSAFGATPAAEHSAAKHSHAKRHSRSTHRLTAAQRKVHLQRLEHRRAVKHRVAGRRLVKHRRSTHRTLAQRKAARRAHERRVAAHRAYERHLAHERWLRRHRAYEARLKHEHVRLYWRSPLRGTHASLVRQNQRDRAEGLTRIRDEAQLMAMVQGHSLIPLPLNDDLRADRRLAYDRRYTRPWTADFLRDLGRAYMHRFGNALVITSAVRPVTYQRRLTWRNGNAAPANGEIASPHEYGATIDIGKKGMTARERAWMRGYLFPIQKAGQIDVEEEFHQACFHVTVYKTYVPAPMARPQTQMADGQMDSDAR